jgi:hypothetical protein
MWTTADLKLWLVVVNLLLTLLVLVRRRWWVPVGP